MEMEVEREIEDGGEGLVVRRLEKRNPKDNWMGKKMDFGLTISAWSKFSFSNGARNKTNNSRACNNKY